MEYKFVETVQGPVVQGEDEILFLSQFGPLLDYVEADPEFVAKAQAFVSEGLAKATEVLLDSLHQPVVGGDPAQLVYSYVSAVNQLKQFVGHYLPSVQNR